MEVILKQDITGVGYKNDIVKVKAGYGNNYLIPNGFAIIANDSNKRLTKENVRQAAHKASKIKQDAEAIASRSEERRVGKECRSRWWPDHYRKKSNMRLQ